MGLVGSSHSKSRSDSDLVQKLDQPPILKSPVVVVVVVIVVVVQYFVVIVGAPKSVTDKLQRVMNAAARVSMWQTESHTSLG